MRVFFDTNVLIAAFATRGLCADPSAGALGTPPRPRILTVSQRRATAGWPGWPRYRALFAGVITMLRYSTGP